MTKKLRKTFRDNQKRPGLPVVVPAKGVRPDPLNLVGKALRRENPYVISK